MNQQQEDTGFSDRNFIDDSEDRPMTQQERQEFDKLLNVFRQGVIKRRLEQNDKKSKDIKKILDEHV